MITGTRRWARARKRFKAGTTFDIGYSQAVVQTGIIPICRLLRLLTLLISLFPSKVGLFSWPFHTNFQNNVSTLLPGFPSFVAILR
jgi:hypothetical protein